MSLIWKQAVKSALIRFAIRNSTVKIERSRFLKQELKKIEADTASEGKTPPQTLSRVLQELRDEGFLLFLNRGLYALNKVALKGIIEDLPDVGLGKSLMGELLELSEVETSSPVAVDKLKVESIVIDEDDESAFPEGKESFRIHRHLERDGEISRRAKAKRLAETGKLDCDVCKMDFHRVYGSLGYGFIEAHHIVPVSILKGGLKTKIGDLALVCSNCHRMLHRGSTLLTLEKLRELVHK